jgi:hypothetical protein
MTDRSEIQVFQAACTMYAPDTTASEMALQLKA